MSPEGCLSMTLRCPGGKDQLVHCWGAYGKSGCITFWVYWPQCFWKNMGTPSLRLSVSFQTGTGRGWDLKVADLRRKEIVKVDLLSFQTTHPDGLGHQGHSKSRDHGIWIQTSSEGAAFPTCACPLEALRSHCEGTGGLGNQLPTYLIANLNKERRQGSEGRKMLCYLFPWDFYSLGGGHCGDPCLS